MSEYVDPYPGRNGKERIVEECGRCGGSGLYDGPSNASFHTSTVGFVTTGCFACMGTGQHSFLVSSARSKARRHAREAAERQRLADIAREREAAFEAAYGELLSRAKSVLSTLRDGDPIHRKLSWNLAGVTGPSEQFEAEVWATELREILEEFDEREEAKRPVPLGRIEIAGTIRSAKYVDSNYGSTLKMLVEGDGWKMWGSVPKQIADAEYDAYYTADGDPAYDGIDVWTKALVGRRITFTGTVKPSDDDASFGFFSRPTQATISELAAAQPHA